MEFNPIKDKRFEEISEFSKVEAELKIRARQQAVVAQIGQRALKGTPLSTLMDEVVTLVAQTLEVEYCKVLETLPDGKNLLLRAGIGWKEGYVGQATVSAGIESQAGYTLLSSEPVIVLDLKQETRFSGPQLLHEHGVVSGMSVIIHGIERPFGVLGVHTSQKRLFTRDDVNFLQSVANVLSSAIERKRTEDELCLSRDQLAIILHGVADGITVQDRTGRLTYANDAAIRVLGYPSQEALLAAPIQEVLSKFDILDEDGNLYPLQQLPGRLVIQGMPSASATIRFRYKETGEERWSLVKARPVLDSQGMTELAVNIFQDITELMVIDRTQRILAETGELLSAPLDYKIRLSNLAQLLVPQMADWCSIHLIEEDESINNLVVVHSDPKKVALVEELQQRYPPDLNAGAGVANVLRTGKSEHYPDIPAEMLERFVQDEEHFKILQELKLRSAMVIPLTGRDRLLGTISLVWADSGRRYSQADVTLAEEIARRAALAVENARLYKQAQDLNAELEHRVAKRTAQLKSMITMLKSEISERKRVEQALRKSEALLQSFFRAAPDATVIVDTEGQVIQVNDQVEAIFGYKQEELVGKSVDLLLPGRFRKGHLTHRARYTSHPVTRPMGAGLSLYGRRKDGQEFPVDIMLSPLITEEGDLVICSVRDITERKRAEEALREKDELLHAAVTSAPLALLAIDHSGAIKLSMGKGLADLWGMVNAGESSIFEVYQELPQVLQSYQRALDGHISQTTVEVGELTFDIQFAPLRDDEGEITGAIGVAHDISDRKQMETELAELQRRLIESAEGERVLLAQELHDGPVQDLHGATYQLESLRDLIEDESALLQLTIINQTMKEVIQSLRSICRELRPPALAPFGLEKAIRSHVEHFSNQYPDHEIHLELSRDGQQLSERIRLALFRIYQQALNNVARHAQAQRIYVRFGIQKEQVILEIEDDGRGFQLPSRWIELARKGHLGLVGASERAESIGGRLQIESAPGQGTVIRVTVPLFPGQEKGGAV